MIARIWHGKVPSSGAAAYHQYLLATGLKDYAAAEGNRGVLLLKKEEGSVTHYYTLTYTIIHLPIGMMLTPLKDLQAKTMKKPGIMPKMLITCWKWSHWFNTMKWLR